LESIAGHAAAGRGKKTVGNSCSFLATEREHNREDTEEEAAGINLPLLCSIGFRRKQNIFWQSCHLAGTMEFSAVTNNFFMFIELPLSSDHLLNGFLVQTDQTKTVWFAQFLMSIKSFLKMSASFQNGNSAHRFKMDMSIS